MALAILKYRGTDRREAEFEADIGTNVYYKIAIGDSKHPLHGLEFVSDVQHETPLLRQENYNPFHSAFTVKMHLNGGKYAQLISYKDSDKTAPAFSKVVSIFADVGDLPDSLLTMSLSQPNKTTVTMPVPCRAVTFSFEESRLSTAMFWDSILQAVRTLAPGVLQIVGGLLQPNSAGSSSGGSQGANNEQLVRIINAVIAALQQPVPATTPTATPPAPMSPPLSIGRFQPMPPRLAQQQMLPLAALLPMLGLLLQQAGPLLQQSPQLLQTVVDSPMRLLNVITDAIQAQEALKLQRRQGDQHHVEQLLSESGRNFLLLQQILRAAAAQPAPVVPPPETSQTASLSYQKSSSAAPKSRVVLEKKTAMTVNGKPKCVYAVGADIKLSAQVQVNNPALKGAIPKMLLKLAIKNSDTRQELFSKKFPVKNAAANSFHELVLTKNELAGLPRNKDLMVCVSAEYLDSRNHAVKAGNDTHLIFLANPYFFKKIGVQVGQAVPLTDRNQHRAFWHKIWEGGAKDKKRWKLELETKYYIYFRPDQTTNGRIETKIQQIQNGETSEREANLEGRMKSGLELTPDALHELLSALGIHPPLAPEQLDALRSDELNRDFNAEAQALLKLKGKGEDTGTLWTYPEIGYFEILLNKITQTDANGQVTQVAEEKVIFPKPVSIHFVGEKISSHV